jgi:23S rRNA (adenine2503-C2)-methyltransferase
MHTHIKDLALPELEAVLASWQQPRFHARQIFSWIYKKGVGDFNAMSNLSACLRERLNSHFVLDAVTLIKKLESVDGTKKLLFDLTDGNAVEAVLIPSEERVTGCVSTQVGCKLACRFCASGALGFQRNLTTGEIVDEILCLKNNSEGARLTHLVFMGTGEPLDNYDNVLKAIRIVNSPDALAIGARRITISTSGVIPGIKRLSEEKLQVELSVSLHAADNATRSLLMPINRKYPLKSLLAACEKYIADTHRQITFEYILIKDLNSNLQNAGKLSTMLKGLNCKVNLIPANPVPELKVQPPNKLQILLFRDCLLKSGIHVTLRKPRGKDIEAACGQLRLGYDKKPRA